ELAAQAAVLVEQLAAVRRAVCDLDEAQALGFGGRLKAARERLARRQRRPRAGQRLGVKLAREAAEDLFLVLELQVERRARHAGLGRDVLHRGAAEAVVREAREGGSQDALARGSDGAGHREPN